MLLKTKPMNFQFSDPLLYELIAMLSSEMDHNNPFGTLYVDSVTCTIVLRLLMRYSNVTHAPIYSPPSGKLNTMQMRLLNDYIQAHLDQKICLDDLARCLHMSVPHFERLFRRSFGRAPYHYVLERRLEQAKLLLTNTTFSLHEVARQSGFANQSHFTRHFTRYVGVSPARYREWVSM